MSFGYRRLIFFIAAPGLVLLLLWALEGLPDFGHYPGPYGDLLTAFAVPERHLTNIVTAVIFDYRALDTLGEEYIFFAAVAGVALLLRGARGEAEASPPEEPPARLWFDRSEAVRRLGAGWIGVTLLFGVYIVLHAPPHSRRGVSGRPAFLGIFGGDSQT